jgi:type I restriction enzyme, S subunit
MSSPDKKTLVEQHRIVAKVDELMALSDQLETKLTTTQTESQKLMEAVLDDALNGQNAIKHMALQP